VGNQVTQAGNEGSILLGAAPGGAVCSCAVARSAPSGEQAGYDEYAERARRVDVLQRAENEFDPIPFDSEAARAFGRVTAAVIAAGRKPRRGTADLMVASTAIAAGLPLFTMNPGDFAGLTDLLAVVPVTRPQMPGER
jgi:predicted nucleic acid-binding protein